jgi:hypothetical protein
MSIFNNFIYASGALGLYGEGYLFHKVHSFPKYPFITKTLTLRPKKGYPLAVLPTIHSVYNKVSLDNPGLAQWLENIDYDTISGNTISLFSDNQRDFLVSVMYLQEHFNHKPLKIEVNFSCPNTGGIYPKYDIPMVDNVQFWLKLNYKQDPNQYSTRNVEGIRLNSNPTTLFSVPCGVSGRKARDNNWKYIKKYGNQFNISGCSWYTIDDIKYLIHELKCKEISIGCQTIINPKEVEKLKDGIEIY